MRRSIGRGRALSVAHGFSQLFTATRRAAKEAFIAGNAIGYVYEKMQEALDFYYSKLAAASHRLSGRRAEVMV